MAGDSTTHPFLEFLRQFRDNPGAMADLRCALIPAREFRSWPYLSRFCRLDHDRERIRLAIVAAAFGIQPENGPAEENLGDVMRRIQKGEHGDDGLSTYELRFKRLLDCDTVDELAPLLHSVFRVAKSRGIPINHNNLLHDLQYWGERVKLNWAARFMRIPTASTDAGGRDE